MPFPRRMPQPREKDDSICSSSSPSPPPSARFTFDALAASARTRSSARELTPRERSHGVARVWTKGRAPRGGEGRDRTKGGKVESSSPRDQKRFPSPTVLCLHLFLALSPLLFDHKRALRLQNYALPVSSWRAAGPDNVESLEPCSHRIRKSSSSSSSLPPLDLFDLDLDDRAFFLRSTSPKRTLVRRIGGAGTRRYAF